MSEENKQVSTDAPATATATPIQPSNPTQPTGIQIGDLQTVLNIIDLASQRGAFKANEMAMVGTTFNKLDGFLKIVEKSQKDANKKPEDQATAEKK